MEKYCRAGRPIYHAACALHDVYLRLHTHTHTHSEYVLLIALPLQQWLHERTLLVRYTYIAYLIFFLQFGIPLRNLCVLLVCLSAYAVLLRVERNSYLHSVSKM
jgi:hypothetical protein